MERQPATAACGSSGSPPLAYAALTEAVPSTPYSVVVQCGAGAPDILGPVGGTGFDPSATWSSDGTQLAWLTASQVYVARASAGGDH